MRILKLNAAFCYVRWCHVQKSVTGIFSKITLSHWILFVIMQRLLTAKLCDILSRTSRQWLIQFFNTNIIPCSRTSLDVRESFPWDMSLHHSVIWSRHFEGNTFIPNIKNISDNDATSYSTISESHPRRHEYLWTTYSAVPLKTQGRTNVTCLLILHAQCIILTSNYSNQLLKIIRNT